MGRQWAGRCLGALVALGWIACAPSAALSPATRAWSSLAGPVTEPQGEVCEAGDGAVEEARAQVLVGARPKPSEAAPARWDRAELPDELDRIRARFGLTAAEQEVLKREGFVVLDRVTWTSYSNAYHQLHQYELPVYISADSILHAMFKLYSNTLEDVEQEALAPQLASAVERMRAALPGWASSVPPEVAADLDLYLAVAAALGSGEAPVLKLGGDGAEAAGWVKRLEEASGIAPVGLFGRERVVDASAWRPRGHYAGSPELSRYFRQAMWLSRLEFNLVSRSSQSSSGVLNAEETPREALGAFALVELADRSGASKELEASARVWGVFAGRREDLGLEELREARASAGVESLRAPDAFERLRGALLGSPQRTTAVHVMAEGVSELPVIATVLGPRIVPDTAALGRLSHDRVAERHQLHAGDVGALLGQRGAARLLKADHATWPELAGVQAAAREEMTRKVGVSADLYAGWLGVLQAAGTRPSGRVPSFMEGPAWEGVQLNTALVGYGQLRHANVLLAGEAYGAAGCVIPDGWVEPTVALYDALLAWLERARGAMEGLGYAPSGLPPWREAAAAAIDGLDPDAEVARGPALLRRFEATVRALKVIAEQELAGQPLTAEQRRFLALVAEVVPAGTDSAARFDGWYLRLFEGPWASMDASDFIASYYTSGQTQEVAYLGARTPRLGIFIVDSDGGPRAVAGPVAAGYEHHGPVSDRLDDAKARELTAWEAPWRSGWAVEAAAPPAGLVVQAFDTELIVESAAPLEGIRVIFMGHHGEELHRMEVSSGPTSTTHPIAWPTVGAEPVYPYAMRVEVGESVGLSESEFASFSVQLGEVAPAEESDSDE